MAPLFPTADRIARFRADFEALAGSGENLLALAVSGGPDSLALLLLAMAALPGHVRAATVDHGLRPESAAEALMVRGVCERLGCPHSTLRINVLRTGEGLQAEARAARYRALAEWAKAEGIARLATAHHLDDQAETLLMRLRRGSGVAGLAGIRPSRCEGGIELLRPLLGWSKAELVAIVEEAGLVPADDPSNRDLRFDRTAARRLLEEGGFLAPAALARTAAALREAEEALAWTAERLWAERAVPQPAALIVDPAGLPAELKRRLLARALAELAPDALPRGEEISRLLAAIDRGEVATLAGVKCSTNEAGWRFEPAPPRRPITPA